MKHLGWHCLASLFTLTLALAGFTPTGFAATDYINVQFSNGGASQTGAAVIGSAGDYWNKTTGSSGTLSLNKTDNTSSGASLSWSASGVWNTGANNAFIAQNTAWKNLFSGHISASSGATMTANFSGLTANIPVRVYFYTEGDSGGNGRKLQVSLNNGAYAATTVGSNNTVYTFIKNQNYLVVDGAANGSGQLNIYVQGVSGAGSGIGQIMGIQLIASDDTPSLTIPALEHVGAGLATLLLQAGADGTGYFTLLAGFDTPCGTGAQVKAGLTSAGATPPYQGSLFLTAGIQGRYTVSNLTQSTDYTVCFTADSPTLLPATPVSANLSTTAAHLNGSAWVTVGAAGFSAEVVDYTSLAFAPDGTPYVAYEDGNNGNKATVMKFDGTGWAAVGAAGFSAGETAFTSLAFAPDGAPYLAYTDGGNSSKATVMKFNGTGWVTVGTAGFSAVRSNDQSLAFAPDGTPYLAYQDGTSGKATVMKFDGAAWVAVGSAGFTAGKVAYTTLAFALDGTPSLAFRDSNNGNKATVMKFTTSQTATTTSLQSSLNPSSFGQSVTLTATVSPAAATGTVEFFDGASSLGSGTLNGGSQATITTSALTAGSHGITGVYSGNADYNTSTSTALTQTVNSVDVSVTIRTNPSGQSITVDGTSYTAPQTFTWTASSSHTIATTQYQNQVSGSRFAFASWSDGGAISHSVTAPATGSATYTATFKTQYQLTTTAGTGGSVLPASGNWYDAGMTPNIIATAAGGYVFTSWNQTGGTGPILNPAGASTTVAMNGPNSVTATFQVPAVSFTAAIGAKSGDSGGLRSWPVTITNTGGTTVTAAQLTGVILSSSGSCKPAATTVFPVILGDIAPGASATGTVTVDFSTCSTPKLKALKFSIAIGYSANSGAATGTLGLSGVGQ